MMTRPNLLLVVPVFLIPQLKLNACHSGLDPASSMKSVRFTDTLYLLDAGTSPA